MTLNELVEAVEYFESEHSGNDTLHDILYYCLCIMDEAEELKQIETQKQYEKDRDMAYRFAQGEVL